MIGERKFKCGITRAILSNSSEKKPGLWALRYSLIRLSVVGYMCLQSPFFHAGKFMEKYFADSGSIYPFLSCIVFMGLKFDHLRKCVEVTSSPRGRF